MMGFLELDYWSDMLMYLKTSVFTDKHRRSKGAHATDTHTHIETHIIHTYTQCAHIMHTYTNAQTQTHTHNTHTLHTHTQMHKHTHYTQTHTP